ncbi:MAG: hypothetical protein WC708_03720 [Lentisphaeria bacterium]
MTENPLIPMGAVTGNPSREFIRKRLTEYREAGITQYLIYPRSGCAVKYLSEEWFALCRTVLEEAQKNQFTAIWIYDDFNLHSLAGGSLRGPHGLLYGGDAGLATGRADDRNLFL